MGLVNSVTRLFNDGEGVVFSDINDIVLGASQRAWEWPGYANMLAEAVASSSAYSLTFQTGPNSNTAYSLGGGPELSFSGLNLTIGNGFLGTYVQPLGVLNGPPDALLPRMRWVYLTSTQTFTLSTAPSGKKRFDYLTIAIADAAANAVSRDYKDATTGALSTTAVNKDQRLTGSFTVTTGSPATPVAGTAPVTPSPAGYVVALVLVNDTAIEAVYDCMMPLGRAHTSLGVPNKTNIYATGTTVLTVPEGPINIGTTGTFYLTPPDFAGDPTARLLGLEVKYAFGTGTTAKLSALEPTGVSLLAPVDLVDITSKFTLDGSDHTALIDMRGYPWTAGTATFYQSLWASGQTFKRGQLTGFGKTIALTCATTGGMNVYWVKWHFAKG